MIVSRKGNTIQSAVDKSSMEYVHDNMKCSRYCNTLIVIVFQSSTVTSE